MLYWKSIPPLLADRRGGTSVVKNLSEFYQIWLSTLKFKDALTENKKVNISVAVEKQQWKKKNTEKNVGQIKRQVEVIWQLGKLVSSTFGKKRMTAHSVFLPSFKVQYCSYWWKLTGCFYFIFFFINLDLD